MANEGRIDSRALQAFADAGGGPVVRHLLERGERVKTRAQALVGKRTRNLHDHIVKRVVIIGGHPAVVVGVSGVRYAGWHHNGTPPHVIHARRAKALTFYWPKAGRVVAFKSVHHPGTRPNPFLTDALAAAR